MRRRGMERRILDRWFLLNHHLLCYFPYHLIYIPVLLSISDSLGQPEVSFILSGVTIQTARVGLRPFIHEDDILVFNSKDSIRHFLVVRAVALPLVVFLYVECLAFDVTAMDWSLVHVGLLEVVDKDV